MSERPAVSVIVPCFNRASLLGYSLESIRRGRADLEIEVVVVDDGSEPALDPALPALRAVGARVVRQANQGLLFARLRGLAEARGRYVLFLDSDDLVTATKLPAQVAAMDESGAEVSYTDSAQCLLDGDFDALSITRHAPSHRTADIAEFFIDVQPPPHSPLWRTEFLRKVVNDAFFPAMPQYNCVAEIWFYHNAAPYRGRVQFVPVGLAVVGLHPGVRLTNHWERLAAASLFVMEAFAAACPAGTSELERAQKFVGERAFASWRRAPRGFSPEYQRRMLGVWRRLTPTPDIDRLGGRLFQLLARILGPVTAGKLIRRWKSQTYEACRTMTDADVAALLDAVPAPRAPGTP